MSRQRLQRSTLRRARRAGFTIVELLVATAITLVVLGLMVQITFSVLGTFDKVSGTISARSQAETVLRYLREDFQSIVWRRDDNVWLLATVQDDQDPINGGKGDADLGSGTDVADWEPDQPKPGIGSTGDFGKDESSLRLDKEGTSGDWIDLKDYRFGQAGVWLRFFTNRTTNTLKGDVAPAAVAYQIVRMKPRPDSEEYRYLFFRSQVRNGRQEDNASKAYSVTDAGYNLAADSNGGYNRPGTPVATENDDIGDPGSIRRPNRSALLATNVIDFGVRFWSVVPPGPTTPDTDPSTLRLIFPADANGRPNEDNRGFAVTALTPSELGQLNGGAGVTYQGTKPYTFTTGFPDFVDVFVRVLTDEGARLIEAYERGLTAPPDATTDAAKDAHWWRIAEEHSEVYTERIPLSARPY